MRQAGFFRRCRLLLSLLGLGLVTLWGTACTQILGIENLPPLPHDAGPLLDATIPVRDMDDDGVADDDDNCPDDRNTDQVDCDGDGTGDVCDTDPDMDVDGVADACDNCPGIGNGSQADCDMDSVGDACDLAFPDMDADGVDDACDNCPGIPNADQIDCDGDGAGSLCDSSDGLDMDTDAIPDGCDNCPSVANIDQVNADADEVGDACDPRPAEGGDTIAYFSGFDGDSAGAAPPGWSLATGGGLVNSQWRVEDGKLVHDPSAQASILYLSGQEVPGDVVIEARFSVNAFVFDLGAVATVSVISRYTNGLAGGGEDMGYVCQLEQGVAGDPVAGVRIREITDTVTGFVDATWSGRLDQTYAIVHTQAGVSGGDFTSRCTVVPPSPDVEATSSLDRPGPASGSIAVRTQRIGAAFDYILVYGLGSSAPAPVAPSSASHPAP